MTREEAKELLLNISAYDIDMQMGMAKQEAIDMAIQALEQTELKSSYNGVKTELNDDAISRQAAIDAMSNSLERVFPEHRDIAERAMNKLPSISTEKTGHWIEQDGYDGDTYYDCSECVESFCLIDGTPADNLYNYCPNCGAKMEVEE